MLQAESLVGCVQLGAGCSVPSYNQAGMHRTAIDRRRRADVVPCVGRSFADSGRR